MKQFLRHHLVFFGCLILFSLLLFKDPFSQRSLIPNFEPYPDTLHYIIPARSLIKGEGFNIVREERALLPSVPPLYSLSLILIYIINNDPRMFYFTNIVIALVSLLVFYQILIRLLSSFLVKGFVLYLYITNYFLYWFPTLAMAENLTLLLFLFFLLLLITKTNKFNILLSSLCFVGFYATKYASAPLVGLSFFTYLVKLYLLWRGEKLKFSTIILYFLTFSLVSIGFLGVEYLTKQNTLLNLLVNFHSSVNNQSGVGVQVSKTPWFSSAYMKINLGHYLNALIGGSERFLWDSTPLVPKFAAIGGLLGLTLGVLLKRFKFISATLFFSLTGSIIFISTFYAVDMRYIIFAIPTLLLGFGIFLQIIIEKTKKQRLNIFIFAGILLLCVFYLFTSTLRIKNQIMLNIRYTETPWYYMSVLELNKYFAADKVLDGKKPIVISPMPPYYIDFFSNQNYTLLPLSKQQEFRSVKEIAWGPNNYSDLLLLYRTYLEKDYIVYVANYGLGNEAYLHEDFNAIKNSFKLILVSSGCYNACNIYKVELKN